MNLGQRVGVRTLARERGGKRVCMPLGCLYMCVRACVCCWQGDTLISIVLTRWRGVSDIVENALHMAVRILFATKSLTPG